MHLRDGQGERRTRDTEKEELKRHMKNRELRFHGNQEENTPRGR